MKKIKKYLIGLTVSMFLINSIAYAAESNLYDNIKKRFIEITETFLHKESDLNENTNNAIEELDEYINNFENDLRKDLENHEYNQVEEAKKTIENEINKIIEKLDEEKYVFFEDSKKSIDEKIQDDLDKALEKIRMRYENEKELD